MLRKLLSIVAAATLIMGSASVTYAATSNENVTVAQTPQWVNTQEIDFSAQNAESNATDYLLIERQVNATKKIQERFYRYSYRIMNSSGLSDSSNVKISFAPDYQQLVIHHINIHRDGKVINVLKPEDIKIISNEDDIDNNILNGTLAALYLIQDARVDDVIDYSYSIIGSNPVYANNFSFFSYISWSAPVDKLYVNVILPKSLNVQHRINGTNQVLEESINGNTRTLSFTKNKTDVIYMDDNVPSWYEPYPFIEITSYKNWQEVASWADQLFNLEKALSPELKQYINELKALEKSVAIDKAIHFVQENVRYLGLEIGINSHKPRQPSEVFSSRFGDCKDKSLLLVTILNELDIEASPALVSTTSRFSIDRFLPSHNVFDHAIVSAEINGQTQWIDPTRTNQGKSLTNLHQADYGKSLLVSATTDDLVDAKPPRKVSGTVDINELITTADYFSAVEWQITTVFSGLEAESIRARIASSGLNSLARAYLNYYAKIYPNIRPIVPLQVSDNKEANEVTLTEYYTVPDYWTLDEGKAQFELYSGYLDNYVKSPSTIQRKDPYWLHWLLEVNHTVNIQFPENIDFTEFSNKTIDNEYLFFSANSSYEARVLSYSTKYYNKRDYIEAKDTALFIDALDEINDWTSYSDSILSVTKDPGIEEMKKLIKHINEKVIGNE